MILVPGTDLAHVGQGGMLDDHDPSSARGPALRRDGRF
jgi:hypothetical protein